MAATTSSHSKNHHKPTIAIIFRRRRFKETTISTTATTTTTTHHHHPSAVSPENTSSGWCCPPAVSSHKPPPLPPPPRPAAGATANTNPSSISPSPESLHTQKEKIPHFDPPVNLGKTQMAPTMTTAAVYGGAGSNQECFTSFNSALTAGILNPTSPPQPPAGERTRSSPTLFEMMANELDSTIPNTNGVLMKRSGNGCSPATVVDRQASMQDRLSDMLSCRSPGNRFNDPNSSDVRLSLRSKDGLSVCVDVHRQILVANTRFFASEISGFGRRLGDNVDPYVVEIGDCDDIEVYVESIKLMYSKDLKRRLMKEDVPRVLGILKVSAAIGFNAGVLSCLEYLEAAPWAEDEEEKVASLLSELQLEGAGAVEVLKRVSVDVTPGDDEINDNQEVLLKLLHVVLEGKDEKARREMKVLVSKMLHENSSKNDLRKESLFSACDKCLDSLRYHFLKASEGDFQEAAQITRQSGNLHWLLDILIDRQISEDFLKLWASQTELSEVHSKVPALHRYEISRVTARLFVGIGKGQLLASKDSRCLLLQTWLVPFYDDFTWMRRGSRGLDRHLIEEGLSNTILTLPLAWQQEIFMAWFDRFLNSGDDCPNIQRGFEVWWKRAFWKKP